MGIPEHIGLFAALAFTLAGCGVVMRIRNALRITDERFLIGAVALAFVDGRPLYDVTARQFLCRAHQTLSAARALLSTPMFQQIIVFGVIALMPAPAESYELAAGSSILLCFCLALVFLFSSLLYAGTEKVMSARLINSPPYQHFSSTRSDPPCGNHDVEPPLPRFILA